MNEHAFGVSLGLRPRTPARCPASPSTVAGSTPVPTPMFDRPRKKAASDTWSDAAFNSGDRIRTCDLRVMSPTSYQTALPRNKVRVPDFRWIRMGCQGTNPRAPRRVTPGGKIHGNSPQIRSATATGRNAGRQGWTTPPRWLQRGPGAILGRGVRRRLRCRPYRCSEPSWVSPPSDR